VTIETLPLLSERHLEALGVASLGVRLRLLAAIRKRYGHTSSLQQSRTSIPSSSASSSSSLSSPVSSSGPSSLYNQGGASGATGSSQLTSSNSAQGAAVSAEHAQQQNIEALTAATRQLQQSTDTLAKAINLLTTLLQKQQLFQLPTGTDDSSSCKKLETDEQSRKIIDLLIRTSKNQQLTVLAFPVRLCFVEHSFIGHDLNSNSMLSSVPLNIIQIASESALVNALSYYSEMCTTASTHLRESIFAASVAILHRTPAARVNAGGLFDSVIGSIPDCEAALELISLLKGSMDQNPGITLRDKSLEDVARKLSSLYEPPAQTSLITGCLSVSQVFSVSAIINESHDRNEELPIRILPFATQDEMLESMKSQSKGQKYSRSSSFRKNSRNEKMIKREEN